MERQKLGRNDPCRCGSGEKYKRCCWTKDRAEGGVWYRAEVEYPKHCPTNRQELHSNTLEFIGLLRQIFGIEFDWKTGSSWLRGKVSKDTIRLVYESFLHYFPREIPLCEICQELSSQPFIGHYWGKMNINTIIPYIGRYALYTPHIVVSNPLCTFWLYDEDSPLQKPEKWEKVTMDKVLFLVSIEPWIKERLITVLPSLSWCEPKMFFGNVLDIARKRIESYKEDYERTFVADGMLELCRSMRPEDIQHLLTKVYPESVSDQLLEAALTISQAEYVKNPQRYAWDVPSEGNRSFIEFGTPDNLESIVFVSNLCDSFLLLGDHVFRRQYDFAVQRDSGIEENPLTELSRAFSELQFNFLNSVSLDFVLNLRKDDRLGRLRTFLVSVWDKASSPEFLERKNIYQEFKDELEQQYSDYQKEWQIIQRTLVRNFALEAAFGGAAVLQGGIDFKTACAGVAAFGIKELLQGYSKRRKHERLPLGVFLDLERKAKKAR